MLKKGVGKMLKQMMKITLIVILTIGFGMNSIAKADSNPTNNSTDVINEKFGMPIVAYGGSLTPAQKEEVKRLLKVTDSSKVKEITVTGEDLVKYIPDGDRNSQMYSSAKITRKEKGQGLVITRVTPNNITEVTDSMYANALLTAGIADADVDVASPIPVTGHSALTGIYKAYEQDGGKKLDQGRMEVANDELNLATDLAKKDGMDQEKVSQLLTEIKKSIAEQKPATKEDVEKIVDEQLKKLEISLSPEDRQLLIDLFEKMRSLNINFDEVKSQLNDITNQIKDKIKDVVNDKGFWQGVLDFFKGIFESIASLFK